MENTDKIVSLEHIFKTYYAGGNPVPVLKDVNLSVGRGEFLGILGTSGSGKSTMLNILGMLDVPTSGVYQLEEVQVDLLTDSELATIRNRKIGFVFQNFNLLPRTSALENVIMPLNYTNNSLSRSECRKRGLAALEQVGIADRAGHHPSQLSGGQQQRVAIARALINRPPLLFADEPTGNLDSHTSVEVMEMFSKLNAEGITVILVTHSEEIANYAKRTIHVSDGQVISGAFKSKGA